MAALTIRELITTWGFDVNDAPLKKAERGVQQLKSGLKRLAVVTAGGAAAMGFFAKRAGEMEQVEIAFRTITGSAEKSRKVIQDLTDFAAKTPFQLNELFGSAKQLLAVGVQQDALVNKMRELGDIAAVFGKERLPTLVRAFGRVKAKGRADLETLNLLIEAGIPIIQVLAKQFGVADKAVFEMLSDGKVSIDDFNKALKTMTSQGGIAFRGMEEQSLSFFGVLSNIQDVLDELARDIGKKFLPELKDMAKQILIFLNANKELIRERVGGFFRAVALNVKDLVRLLGGLEKVLKLVTAGFAIFTSGLILSGIASVVVGLKGMLAIMKLLNISLLAIVGKFLLLASTFAAALLIADDLFSFFQGKESVTGDIVKFFGRMKEKIDETIPVLGRLVDSMKLLFKIVASPFVLAQRLGQKLDRALGLTVAPNTTPRGAVQPGANSGSAVSVKQEINVNGSTLPPEEQRKVIEGGVSKAMGQLLRETSRAVTPNLER